MVEAPERIKTNGLGCYGPVDGCLAAEYVRADLYTALEAKLAVRTGEVKPLDEDDYEKIISAAAINMRKATSGIRGQMVTAQDSLDWWVMKETERRILSALEATPPAPKVTEAPRHWVTVRVEDTGDGLIIHTEDAREFGLQPDKHYQGHFLPDGRYRLALTALGAK